MKTFSLAIAITAMNQPINEKPLFSSGTDYLEISPIVAISICNSLKKFNESNQHLQNFNIVVEPQNETILVSFNAKHAPGERMLGGNTSLGRSLTYYTSAIDGRILKERWQK